MGIHTADAIVLRHYPYRETSALVTCLTDRFGKIKGLIKGLCAPGTRYRSAMDPLTLNRIVFYDTRTSSLHLISQCDLLEDYPALARDVEMMRVAASCAELTDALIELEEPQPRVFVLLNETLARLAGGQATREAIRIHGVLRLLRLAGFHPQLDECTGCATQQVRRGFWSPRQGGLLCERCLHEDPKAQEMTPEVLAILSACAEADGPMWLEPAQAQIIQRHLDEFLRWRLDRPLKTLEARGSGLKAENTRASSLQPPA